MHAQELVHLRTFEDPLVRHRVRPTLLQPVWHVAGFALGAATALLGEKAAMACTVAVEAVIDEHYAGQTRALEDDQAATNDTSAAIRQAELQQRDTGLAKAAQEDPGHELPN